MIFVIAILISMVLAWFWVEGIDYMHKNHKDYKGYDLFDEEDEEGQ